MSLRNIIPGADRGQKQLLNQLQRTLSEVSAACEENEVLLDEFARSAHPDADVQSETDVSTSLHREHNSSVRARSLSRIASRSLSRAASRSRSWTASSDEALRTSVVFGKQMGERKTHGAKWDDEEAGPSHQDDSLSPSIVGPGDGHSTEMIEMMLSRKLHEPNRSGPTKSGKTSVLAAGKTEKKGSKGTHPTVSQILSDMMKENEMRRQAATYRLYYKKPPKFRESLLSAVEGKPDTEDESSPGIVDVAITNREFTQSEPCLRTNKVANLDVLVPTLKRRSDWTGNPEVFQGGVKPTRRSKIMFSPLVSKTFD